MGNYRQAVYHSATDHQLSQHQQHLTHAHTNPHHPPARTARRTPLCCPAAEGTAACPRLQERQCSSFQPQCQCSVKQKAYGHMVAALLSNDSQQQTKRTLPLHEDAPTFACKVSRWSAGRLVMTTCSGRATASARGACASRSALTCGKETHE